MKKGQIVAAVLIVITMLVAACAPQAAPAKPAAPGQPQKAAWEVQWEEMVVAAKQEGKVSLVLGGVGDVVRTALATKVQEKFGVGLEALAGRGGETSRKVISERAAGIYSFDIWLGGSNTPISTLKPAGVFQPMEPVFILPELTNPEVMKKTWWRGTPYWLDKDHYVVSVTQTIDQGMGYNTNLVQPGELTSWRDLLNPKWRGKVAIADPTSPGAGISWFCTMYNRMGEDYLKQVAETKPIIIRDDRLVMDWLAQGKVAIVLSPEQQLVAQFQKAGAPIKTARPKEGTWLSSDTSNLGLFNNPAHPNAAKLFINWMLSKEGSETYAVPAAGQALRLDVRTDYLRPEQLRPMGEKLVDYQKDLESELLKTQEYSKLAKQIFAYAAQ